MKIAYSRDADVLTIQLSEGRLSDSTDVAEGVIVHLSEKGRPLEIEILDGPHHDHRQQSGRGFPGGAVSRRLMGLLP